MLIPNTINTTGPNSSIHEQEKAANYNPLPELGLQTPVEHSSASSDGKDLDRSRQASPIAEQTESEINRSNSLKDEGVFSFSPNH